MENRKRNIQMKFYVTEEEKRLIDEKMKQLPIKQYEYRKSPDKEKYLRGHESEIILFEAAARALKEMQIKKLPDLAALRKEYRSLNDRKTKLYEDYRQAKKQMQEYGVVKKNVDKFLCAALHIGSDIFAVGAGIGQKPFFIKGLRWLRKKDHSSRRFLLILGNGKLLSAVPIGVAG